MPFDVVLLVDIAAIIIVAKVFGEIAERLRTDAMIGELIAGLLLGPMLAWVTPGPFLENLAFLGLLMLMFFIGLDVSYDDIKRHSYAGGVLALFTSLFAFLAGLAFGFFVFNSMVIGAVIGVAIMGTSTAIPLKLTSKAGMIKTKLGQVMVSMSMADDIATIIGLSILVKWLTSGNIEVVPAVTLMFAILGFILVIMAFGSKVIEKILNIFSKMKDEQMLVAIPLAIAFLIAYASEQLGIAALIGTFLAGAAMSGNRHVKGSIEPKMRTIGYGFFIPIFFAYSAMIINLQSLLQYWWLMAVITAIAILSKILGVYASGGFYGFKGKEMGILALSTIPRGEYSIAIAQIMLGMSVIASEVYGALIGMAIITIILTPILLKAYTRRSYYAGF
ncbi:MAG: cation:proton antiporter [Candidatus Aenigmarchaeota archaeon]|nr:cation:proton antiporter [Candidatus Aenigmarchaeota archaeon]